MAEIGAGGSPHASDRAYDLTECQRQFGGIGQAHSEGAIMMVLELSMALGDDMFTLETLGRFTGIGSASGGAGTAAGRTGVSLGLRLGMPDMPAPANGLRLPLNSEVVFWNAALVWFRARGASSKRATSSSTGA